MTCPGFLKRSTLLFQRHCFSQIHRYLKKPLYKLLGVREELNFYIQERIRNDEANLPIYEGNSPYGN
jgi:hypothetical protein